MWAHLCNALWRAGGEGAKVLKEDIFIQLMKFAKAPHMVPGAC